MAKILITGSNGGFGILTVKTLLNQGHQVVATMRNIDSKNKAVAEELSGLGAKVALIERELMGGDCLNVGCVPSKGVISAARVAAIAGGCDCEL